VRYYYVPAASKTMAIQSLRRKYLQKLLLSCCTKATLLGTLGIVSLISLVACGRSPQSKEANFLERGDRFARQKDWPRALLEYRAAAQAIPKDSEPYYHLGLAYQQMNDPENAVRVYRQALDRNPNHSGARLKLAGIMATNGDQQVLEEAEKRLKGFVQTPSGNSETLDFLAVTEFRLGRVEDATKILQQATEKYPSSLESARLLAELRLKNNDFHGAEQILKAATDKSPASPDAHLALGRLYLRSQRPEQAESEFRRALALNPQFAPALLDLASLLTGVKRLDQAEGIYKQLADGPNKNYRHLYGLFLFQRGKTDAALDEFRRLVRQDGSDRTARSLLVAVYMALNRIPEARQILTDALNTNEKDNDALLERAGLYLRTGQLADAERDLQQVIRNQPDSAAAHFEMAIAKRMRGQNKSERQELIEALLHHPEFLPARLELARLYVRTDEAKSALALLDGAPLEQRNLPEVRVERNWALLGVGDREAAGTAIQQLLASDRAADALEQEGFLKMSTRDFAGARRDADEILAKTRRICEPCASWLTAIRPKSNHC
jgi:tetratricopeptide (TPR) repeat protein